jgi:hypothetical protein
MARWRFLDYYTDANPPKCPIWDWLGKQDKRTLAAFDATRGILQGVPNWDDPEVLEFKFFRDGPFAGLGELRFHIFEKVAATKKQIKRRFRIAGIWRPDEHEFIMLTGCEKSGKIKIPQDAFEQAMALKLAFEQEKGVLDDHR